MEEDKYPSLPSNYVSLVQLQERWLKEQQRKQREKEEEERKQREKEEQERKREEDQRNRSRKQNEERIVSNSVSISSRNFRRNSRIRTARDRRAVELSKPNSEESQGDAVVVPDDQKKDELKKKWRNKRRSNTKPKIEENGTLAGGTAHLSPGDEQVEKLQVVMIEREGEKEGIGSEFRRKPKVEENGTLARGTVKLSPEDKQKEKLQVVVIEREGEKEEIGSEFRRKPKVEENGTLARGTVKLSLEDKQKEKLQVAVIDREGGKEGIRGQFRRNGDYRRVNGKVSSQRVPADETTVLVRSFEDMSLNGGKYGNLGSTAEMNGGRWKFGRGSARFDHQKMWKRRDCNLVWVKKGERIDNDVVGTPSSGLLVKAGKYKKQHPGQSMQN